MTSVNLSTELFEVSDRPVWVALRQPEDSALVFSSDEEVALDILKMCLSRCRSIEDVFGIYLEGIDIFEGEVIEDCSVCVVFQ